MTCPAFQAHVKTWNVETAKRITVKITLWLLCYCCVRDFVQVSAKLILVFYLKSEADCILIIVRGGENQQVFKIQDGLVVHIKPGHISVKHFDLSQPN